MRCTRLQIACLLVTGYSGLFAQTIDSVRRIRERIDNNVSVALQNNRAAKAAPQFDRGAADPQFVLSDLAFLFKPSSDQQADLDQFLGDVQNPASGIYHQWLTPEQYADRFGLSAADVNQVAEWLQAQGFQVTYHARGRNWIAFSGSAAQVEAAFRTAIHRYLVDGEEHFANRTDPSIPVALAAVVSAIRGLDNFRLNPAQRQRSMVRRVQPDFNDGTGFHFLAPDDLAAIYDLNSLYSVGIDGSGQKVAVAGQTDVVLSDIAAFRSIFNLPANAPQLVLYGRDPGTRSGDQSEAEMDLEWTGAVARNATVLYVYSTDVFNSVQYAVDQNLAPVISMSYGGCENDNTGVLQTYRNLAQQAAAEGISWLASSGDTGAAACDSSSSSSASRGPSVMFPASIPEVTAVGGTEFVDGAGSYWNSTNGANQGSAVGYIPETTWNDTSRNGTLTASGGGASISFAAPSYQTGAGFPNNGFRNVPDVSLTASADHDGYIMCVAPTNCPSNWRSLGEGSGYTVVGGTSASVQVFGGILTLINHYLASSGLQSKAGLGSANQALYWLAQNSP
ncbi:MAG TPA: S53 family peptidase, partial [Bryobacteraceae bacterium]